MHAYIHIYECICINSIFSETCYISIFKKISIDLEKLWLHFCGDWYKLQQQSRACDCCDELWYLRYLSIYLHLMGTVKYKKFSVPSIMTLRRSVTIFGHNLVTWQFRRDKMLMCDNILECFWDKWRFVGVCEGEWVKKNSNPGSPGKMWAHFKCNINWFNDIVWNLGGCILGGTFELF